MRLVEVPEFGGKLGEMHGLIVAEVVHRPLTALTLQHVLRRSADVVGEYALNGARGDREVSRQVGHPLRVADVPEAKRTLEQRGVEFSGEHDTGACKMAFFKDTEGNALMLHRRYAP